MNGEGQSMPKCDTGKVLSSLINFMCLSKMTAPKTKPAKHEVRDVLRFLTAIHYGPKVMSYEQKG